MRSLRKVSLASVRDYGNLRLSQFEDFPPGLEDLSLIGAKIKVSLATQSHFSKSVSPDQPRTLDRKDPPTAKNVLLKPDKRLATTEETFFNRIGF